MSSSDSREAIDLSALSEQDKNMFLSERLSKFKMTITVCIIYGLIAFILLLLAVFTSWGKRFLYNDMLAFVVTFIIGTTIIVIWLANNIYNFKPTKPSDKLAYDAELCPDFWKLENIDTPNQLDSQNRSYLNSSLNPNHFKYKCVLDNNLFQRGKFIEADNKKPVDEKKNYKITASQNLYVPVTDKDKTGIKKTETFEKFKEHAANMSGYTYGNGVLTQNSADSLRDGNEIFHKDKVPLTCDTVYPLYLSVMDKQNSEKDPSEPTNRFRCAYASACGIPWTEAGCV